MPGKNWNMNPMIQQVNCSEFSKNASDYANIVL